MPITLSTPALLFPAISLLMLAYTNRFFGLAAIIRNLHKSHTESPDPVLLLEIANMRRRMRLIRDMQTFGVLGLILCTVSMLFLFLGLYRVGQCVFGAAILSMVLSLLWSLVEIRLSGRALDLHLQDLEMDEKRKT